MIQIGQFGQGRIILGIARQEAQQGDVADDQGEQDVAFHCRDGVVTPAEGDQDECGDEGEDRVAAHAGRGGGDGAEDRRQAENQQKVGNVRADDIAERQPGRTGQGRLDGDHQFRRRGAEGDDGQTDQKWWQFPDSRQAGTAPNEEVAAKQQHDKTPENEGKEHWSSHVGFLPWSD